MELARDYIAGFFDGEGSVSIGRCTTPGEKVKRGKPGQMYEKYFLTVQLTQRTREVLDAVQIMYGGAFCGRNDHSINHRTK